MGDMFVTITSFIPELIKFNKIYLMRTPSIIVCATAAVMKNALS